MGYRDLVLADGPVAYWPMDEASGTTVKDVVGASAMTLSGTYTLASAGPFPEVGQAGKAIVWDGSSGKGSVADNAALSVTGAITLETWIKTSAASGIFLCKAVTPFGNLADRCYEMDMLSNTIYFVLGNRSSTTTTAAIAATGINNGAWHHLVGTWDGTTGAGKQVLYVDGVSVATGSPTITSISDTADALTVGKPNGVNNFPLNGSQAHAAIYNKALTSDQVLAHFKEGRRGGVVGG